MAGFRILMHDDEWQRRKNALRGGLVDTTDLMEEWGEIIQTSIAENFEVGGRPAWKPLAASTIQARIGARKQLRKASAANFKSRKLFKITFLRTLVVTGTLQKVTVKPEAQRVIIGSSPAAKEYAAIHQHGGQAGRGRKVTIPARPYIVLQDEDHAEMGRAGRLYLQRLAQ